MSIGAANHPDGFSKELSFCHLSGLRFCAIRVVLAVAAPERSNQRGSARLLPFHGSLRHSAGDRFYGAGETVHLGVGMILRPEPPDADRNREDKHRASEGLHMRCSYGELMMDRARLRNLQSVQRLGRNRGLLAMLKFF